jgi:hypothetical protein
MEQFPVREGKIGGTYADVSSAAEFRQTETVRLGARRHADNAALLKN